MLRITSMGCEDGSIRLKLEGRLIYQWVDLLRQTCRSHQCQTDNPLILDLSAVAFASRDGIQLLRRLQQEGINCIFWSPFLKELSREIS